MKGQNFQSIIKWYYLIMQYISKLVQLLDNEKKDPNALGLTLSVLKCGLFSKDVEVSNSCCRALNQIAQQVFEKSENSDGPPLFAMIWDWFISEKSSPSPQKSPSKNLKQTKLAKNQDHEILLRECGLQGFMRALRMHKGNFMENFAMTIVQFGCQNQVDLFTLQLRDKCNSNFEYMHLIQDAFTILTQTQRGKTALVDSGVLVQLIDICLHICEGQATSPALIDEKQMASTFLVDAWKFKPDLVQNAANQNWMPDAIIQSLKKGCREPKSKAIRFTAIQLMFTLVDGFAGERNQYAPIIYKALTFICIDFYMDLELREEMLKSFINLFKLHQNIPIAILCEPLFKQIDINLQKQEYVNPKNSHNIMQPSQEILNLNTTDFELFLAVSLHPKLTAAMAIQLLQIVFQIARKHVIFTRVSLKLLLTVLSRFENNTQIFEFCQNQVKDLLKIISEQDQIKISIYNKIRDSKGGKSQTLKKKVSIVQQSANAAFTSIAQNSQNLKAQQLNRAGSPTSQDKFADVIDDQKIQGFLKPSIHIEESVQYMSMKTSEKLIVNLLQCLIQTGIKVLAQFMRGQIIDSYLKTERKLKFQNKGLLYLLGFYDQDVQKLIQFSKIQSLKSEKEKKKTDKVASRSGVLNTSADGDSASESGFQRQTDKNDARPYPQYKSLERNKHMQLMSTHDASSAIDLGVQDIKAPTLQILATNQRSSQMLKGQDRRPDFSSDYFLSQQKGGTQLSPVRGPNFENDREYNARQVASDEIHHLLGSQSSRQKRQGSLNARKSKKLPPIASAQKEAQVNLFGVIVKLYDINEDTQEEQQKYIIWVKEKIKVYKAMQTKYSSARVEKPRAQVATFESVKEQQKFMSLSTVFQFLSDFKISKLEANREDVKRIIKLINLRQPNNLNTTSNLDLEGFIEFVLQLGYFMYKSVSSQPSKFLPLLFEKFKEVSNASRVPLFQRLLDDPQAPPLGDKQFLQRLTDLVNQNPSYQLPPGFTKVKVEVMTEKQSSDPRKYQTEAQKISTQILNELFESLFDIPLRQSHVFFEQKWVVRPDIFVLKSKIQKDNQKRYPQQQIQGMQNRYAKSPDQRNDQQTQKQGSPAPHKKTKELIRDALDTADDSSKQNYKRGIYPAIKLLTSPRNQRLVPKDLSKNKNISPPLRSEADLLPSLRLALLKNNQDVLGPDRVLTECALLLNEMVSTVEGQWTQDYSQPYDYLDRSIPKDSHDGYYPHGSTKKTSVQKSATINKARLAQIEKQQLEEAEKLERDKRILRRKEEVEKDMLEVLRQKNQKEEQKLQKMKEIAERDQKMEEKKRLIKQKIYDSIKEEFQAERLPLIQQKKQLQNEIKRQKKEQEQVKREEARRKVEENIEKLKEDFTNHTKKREENSLLKAQRDEAIKLIETQRRQEITDQLMQNRDKKVQSLLLQFEEIFFGEPGTQLYEVFPQFDERAPNSFPKSDEQGSNQVTYECLRKMFDEKQIYGSKSDFSALLQFIDTQTIGYLSFNDLVQAFKLSNQENRSQPKAPVSSYKQQSLRRPRQSLNVKGGNIYDNLSQKSPSIKRNESIIKNNLSLPSLPYSDIKLSQSLINLQKNKNLSVSISANKSIAKDQAVAQKDTKQLIKIKQQENLSYQTRAPEKLPQQQKQTQQNPEAAKNNQQLQQQSSNSIQQQTKLGALPLELSKVPDSKQNLQNTNQAYQPYRGNPQQYLQSPGLPVQQNLNQYQQQQRSMAELQRVNLDQQSQRASQAQRFLPQQYQPISYPQAQQQINLHPQQQQQQFQGPPQMRGGQDQRQIQQNQPQRLDPQLQPNQPQNIQQQRLGGPPHLQQIKK